ncbi:hypothetical protein ThvES_00021160, partial [Thiovulum sp. ES]
MISDSVQKTIPSWLSNIDEEIEDNVLKEQKHESFPDTQSANTPLAFDIEEGVFYIFHGDNKIYYIEDGSLNTFTTVSENINAPTGIKYHNGDIYIYGFNDAGIYKVTPMEQEFISDDITEEYAIERSFIDFANDGTKVVAYTTSGLNKSLKLLVDDLEVTLTGETDHLAPTAMFLDKDKNLVTITNDIANTKLI